MLGQGCQDTCVLPRSPCFAGREIHVFYCMYYVLSLPRVSCGDAWLGASPEILTLSPFPEITASRSPPPTEVRESHLGTTGQLCRPGTNRFA